MKRIFLATAACVCAALILLTGCFRFSEGNNNSSGTATTTAAVPNESEYPADSTSTTTVIPHEGGEHPTLAIENYDEYLRFMNEAEQARDLLPYDAFKKLGQFSLFVITSGGFNGEKFSGDCSQYRYTFSDGSDYNVTISVTDLSKHELKSDYAKIDPDPGKENLRYVDENQSGYLVLDGCEYMYTGGKLLWISWTEENTEYRIVGNSILADYPEGKDTFASKLLSRSSFNECLAELKNDIGIYKSLYSSPPMINPVSFNSFSELQNAIDPQNEEKLYSYFAEQLDEDEIIGNVRYDEIIGNVRYMVKAIQSYNNAVPYLNGTPIELLNKEGYSNITFFAIEKYGLPCIFYNPETSYISIRYIPDEYLQNRETKLLASDLIKNLAPQYPNTDYYSYYCKNVYNTEISLSDRKVTALVYEYKSDNRNSTFFVYDNLLVEVRNNPEIWDADWFASLSFGAFPDEPEPSGAVQLNLDFTSIKEMYDTVTQEKLTDGQKRHIAEMFPKDETGKTLMCDFDNLYEPALPENWTTNGASWYGPYYAFQIASGDKFGFVTWLPETLYSETFQRDYTDFFDNERITVTKTENEGGKEKTFYETGMGGSMQERYVLYEGERTITVDKCYFLSVGSELVPDSKDVPVSVRLYCEEGEELFYTVMLYNFGSAPDDQLLKQFSMTPFVGS